MTIDREGTDPITGERGSNQRLVGNSHGDSSRKTVTENKVQSGRLPEITGPPIGTADAPNPAGRKSDTSLED